MTTKTKVKAPKATKPKATKATAAKAPALSAAEKAALENDQHADKIVRKDGENTVVPFSDPEREALAGKATSAATRAAQQDADDREGRTPTESVELVTVMVVRDNSRTPVKVFPHEVALLEEIHGTDNIAEVATETVDVADFDPDSELDRLRRKYGKNAEEAIGRLFGSDGSRIAAANGITYKRNRTRNRSGEGSMMIDHSTGQDNTLEARGKVARIVHKDTAQKTTKR